MRLQLVEEQKEACTFLVTSALKKTNTFSWIIHTYYTYIIWNIYIYPTNLAFSAIYDTFKNEIQHKLTEETFLHFLVRPND